MDNNVRPIFKRLTQHRSSLESDENYSLAKKYLKGCSGVISFVIKGGKENAMRFMNTLQHPCFHDICLLPIGVRIRNSMIRFIRLRCVLHPASETHRQLTEEQLKAAGIDSGMVRLSVGLEYVEDIIEDIPHILTF